MKKFIVYMPIEGTISFEVEAKDAEDAEVQVLSGFGTEGDLEWHESDGEYTVEEVLE